MTREIKFRGKSIDDEHGITWATGSLIKERDGRTFINNPLSGVSKFNGDCLGSIVVLVEVIPDTVGEFTGLLDKNGKEIYEGDIVEFLQGNFKEKEDITYENYAGFSPFCCDDDYCPYPNGSSVEVVGNIHETPGLLEDKP